jgi:N-acyl-D-amino-acid deacylase
VLPVAVPLALALATALGCTYAPRPEPLPAGEPDAAPAAPSEATPCLDLVVRGGTVYDGSGGPPQRVDVGICRDRITILGDLGEYTGAKEIDARGLAVAPGFINMLSWATESLLHDGRAMSDVAQGVTLEVFGEGWSMGPLDEAMKELMVQEQGDIRFDVAWTTLAEYLEHLERRGVAVNVASFVGATTVRIHELGYEDREPTPEELARMVALVRQAMDEGALGVGSSLIYAPAFYAKTPELVALARAAGERGGMYVTHMRSEGGRLLEAVDEVLAIAREAGVRAEIYHLKAAGRGNWGKIDALLDKIETARAAGVELTADMYTYTAGATGLDAAMPPWVQEGGLQAWIGRLRDPAVRERVAREMATPSDEWENLYLGAGADRMLLVAFKNDALKPLTGKTLAEVAAMRGKSPEQTAMDLVVEDGSRVGTIYFLMSEDNVRRQVALPWVSFGSDAEAPAPEGVFLESNPHPRAYGNFARLLGRYVRDEGLVPLAEAIRRLTALPAETLRLRERGRLAPGFHADVVVFDAAAIADRATFEQPHQLAVGVRHVLVNGVPVLRDGQHTGELPGRALRGPGWTGWSR